MNKFFLMVVLLPTLIFPSGCASPAKEAKVGNWDNHAERMANDDFKSQLNGSQGR